MPEYKTCFYWRLLMQKILPTLHTSPFPAHWIRLSKHTFFCFTMHVIFLLFILFHFICLLPWRNYWFVYTRRVYLMYTFILNKTKINKTKLTMKSEAFRTSNCALPNHQGEVRNLNNLKINIRKITKSPLALRSCNNQTCSKHEHGQTAFHVRCRKSNRSFTPGSTGYD